MLDQFLTLSTLRAEAAPQVFMREGVQQFAQAVRDEMDIEVVVVT